MLDLYGKQIEAVDLKLMRKKIVEWLR